MVNYEMRGSVCSLVPYVLLRVLLLSLCANGAALGQPNQGIFLFIEFLRKFSNALASCTTTTPIMVNTVGICIV